MIALLLAAPPFFPTLTPIPSAVPPGDELLVSSFQPANVHRFDAETASYELDYGPGPLAGTLGATLGPDGLVYVASEGSDQVLRYEPTTGAFVDTFVEDDPNTSHDETGGLDDPSAVVFGPDGRLYVGSFATDAVLAYDGRTGVFDGVFVQPADGNLDGPDAGMVFGPDGDLYVPSYWNHRVKRYDGATGAFVSNFFKPAASGLTNPRTVLFLDDGSALVTSEGTNEVLRFDGATGDFLGALVTDDPNTSQDDTGGLDAPTGMGLGPDGRLWVASLGTNEVKRYDLASGAYLDDPVPAGAGGVNVPTFLFFRPRAGTTCAGAPNSAGPGASLTARGSGSVSANRFSLALAWGPPGELAVFVQSATYDFVPAGDGFLCLGAPLYRLGVQPLDGGGAASFTLDFASPPDVGATVLPGSSWHFQVGYRDSQAGGSGFNFSSALRVAFGS